MTKLKNLSGLISDTKLTMSDSKVWKTIDSVHNSNTECDAPHENQAY